MIKQCWINSVGFWATLFWDKSSCDPWSWFSSFFLALLLFYRIRWLQRTHPWCINLHIIWSHMPQKQQQLESYNGWLDPLPQFRTLREPGSCTLYRQLSRLSIGQLVRRNCMNCTPTKACSLLPAENDGDFRTDAFFTGWDRTVWFEDSLSFANDL